MISGDSMQVYKHMDIGTAKATRDEMDGIPHHMIDILEPDESFSAYEFKKRAEACIEDIINRGKLPIIAGGTGLYIQSLLYNYAFEDETVSLKKCKLFMRNLQNSNNITMRSYIII